MNVNAKALVGVHVCVGIYAGSAIVSDVRVGGDGGVGGLSACLGGVWFEVFAVHRASFVFVNKKRK